MALANYEFVEFFPECNKIIDGYVSGENCHQVFYDEFFDQHNISNIKLDKKKCSAAMSYLIYIDYNNILPNISKKSGFSYFYYWIHNELKSINKRENTQKVYKAFIKDHNRIYTIHDYDKYKEIFFNDNELEELKTLYDMYKCLHNIKDIGISNEETSFCNTVLSYFSAYSTCFRSEIKMIKNKWNNIDEELGILEPSESFNSNTKWMYNILYNSDYIFYLINNLELAFLLNLIYIFRSIPQ
ncbi:variable surface protein [Plasmodium gonderi]|uniref:Variable surface protein n=1 Tax=Plasmodium gonderi TaxID=77519 RepID=A0A1Y1JP24_PLAGO|nr:variable surface protein [Plasmodium gonderi]GAW83990.1 variable surface protein [Plasmodium gonderi]